MKRAVFCALVFCLVGSAGQARADWHSFWDRVHLDFHRMNAYPSPFQEMDRRLTALPVARMMSKGWRLQNTLDDPLFDEETQTLNHAGELKVRHILTQNPMHRRTVFVLNGPNQPGTNTRMASVRQVVMAINNTNAEPDVILTTVAPRQGQASYYDRVQRGYESTTPSPRLPSGN